jgi:Asp-tRNA(Asn)/Glu-tRNA(Gln) amidotransferase A subunit family amidase
LRRNDAQRPHGVRASILDYFARTGNFVGPLHGIPIAVKDNYDTVDMRTTAGAVADYANDKPPKDATMVEKLRAAGAIIHQSRRICPGRHRPQHTRRPDLQSL